jgi:hypothetical protein
MNVFKKSISFIALVLFANAFGMETNNVEIIEANYMEGNREVTKPAIYRKDIFKYVTGMTEPEFVEQYKNTGTMPQLPANMAKLVSNMDHSMMTLQELRNAAQNTLSPNKNGKLSIVHVDVVKYPNLRHLIDIGALQGAYPGAVFQTASRPNGLEGQQKAYLPNKDTFKAEDGFNKIMGKFAVQGEEAQISAALRGIYEIYNTPQLINFFDKLNIDISADGNLTDIDVDFLNNNSMESLSDLIRLDHWKNAPVTTGYANVLYQSEGIKKVQNLNAAAREKNIEDANALISPAHFISQVNVTALDVNKNRNKTQDLFVKKFGNNEAAVESMHKVAKAALRAAYEGTIYCALLDNKKDVFVTLVGGGSFDNKLEWIVDTLTALKDVIKQSGLNITVVAVEINGHLQNPDNKDAWENLQNLALTTGGTVSSNGQ